MKKSILAVLCLFLAACTTQHDCYRENCFVSETEVTEDMRKIHEILMKYYKATAKMDLEYNLKFIDVVCKLFNKNNKQLNKEIDKLLKIYQSAEKQQIRKNLREDLKKTLKGLKLDYKQVVLLAKNMEADYAKIINENKQRFAPYKTRAIEILKFLDKQIEKDYDGYYENGLNRSARFMVYFRMADVVYDKYDKFSVYSSIISTLQQYIKNGILIDSFLDEHKSAIPPKDEPYTYSLSYYVGSLTPGDTKSGEELFEAANNAVTNEKMDKQELSDLVSKISNYMITAASGIVAIQHDVTDKIDYDNRRSAYYESKLNNFSWRRQLITDLVDKNPKFEDFEREIDKLSTRLAYQTYYETNTARFLYKEWREKYYPRMNKFFANAVILANRLYNVVKDEVIPTNATYVEQYKHKSNLQNISNIREIANIGVEKIFSNVDCYIDSQEEIKKSILNGFLKTREAYLRNMAKK